MKAPPQHMPEQQQAFMNRPPPEYRGGTPQHPQGYAHRQMGPQGQQNPLQTMQNMVNQTPASQHLPPEGVYGPPPRHPMGYGMRPAMMGHVKGYGGAEPMMAPSPRRRNSDTMTTAARRRKRTSTR